MNADLNQNCGFQTKNKVKKTELTLFQVFSDPRSSAQIRG